MLVMGFGCNSGSSCRRVGFDYVIRGCRVDASDLCENSAVASTLRICVLMRLSRRRVGFVQNTTRQASKSQELCRITNTRDNPSVISVGAFSLMEALAFCICCAFSWPF